MSSSNSPNEYSTVKLKIFVLSVRDNLRDVIIGNLGFRSGNDRESRELISPALGTRATFPHCAFVLCDSRREVHVKYREPSKNFPLIVLCSTYNTTILPERISKHSLSLLINYRLQKGQAFEFFYRHINYFCINSPLYLLEMKIPSFSRVSKTFTKGNIISRYGDTL